MLSDRLDLLPRHALAGGLTVFEANGWRARLLGLALLDALPHEHALLIRRCRSVHTFGMRFPLDLVFLDGSGAIVRLVSGTAQRRGFGARAAHAVLETRAGQAERFIEAGAGGLARTAD